MTTDAAFLKALMMWKEPMTDAVSCEIDPVDYSCDNGLLFSAEAYAITGCCLAAYSFSDVALQYEQSAGALLRHPTSTELTSWDDHLAAAAVSTFMAKRILAYGEANHWTWGGKYLGRFPIFIPTVKASAGVKLTLTERLAASLAFIANMFEGYPHTSGKLLLWLASRALYGKYFTLDRVINLWRFVQGRRYKTAGLREVMGIYFKPRNGVPHPFSVYAPKEFK